MRDTITMCGTMEREMNDNKKKTRRLQNIHISFVGYDRPDSELEEFLLCCILFDGKNIVHATTCILNLISLEFSGVSTFAKIRNMVQNKTLLKNLQKVGIDKDCEKIAKIFKKVSNANVNLKTCTIKELETIAKLSPKISRLFILYTRKDAKCAVLDTKTLKWMSTFLQNIPKETPKERKKYVQLEKMVLDYCEVSHISPVELYEKVIKKL